MGGSDYAIQGYGSASVKMSAQKGRYEMLIWEDSESEHEAISVNGLALSLRSRT